MIAGFRADGILLSPWVRATVDAGIGMRALDSERWRV